MIPDEDGTYHNAGMQNAFTVPVGWASLANQYEATNKQEEYLDFIGRAREEPLLGFYFDPANVEQEIKATDAVLEKYQSILSGKCPDGFSDFDSAYEAMLEELDEAGIARIIQEVKAQL